MTTEQKFGPQTEEVERLLAVLRTVTPEEQRACNRALAVVPNEVWYPTLRRAGDASRGSGHPRHEEWAALCDALDPAAPPVWVWAAWALVIRDQIDPEDFEVIVGPIGDVLGRCWKETHDVRTV